MKSYRELNVWQASVAFSIDVYHLTKSFPKEEMFGLSSQLRRAAVSIPSNIAEGFGRTHLNEYLHHLSFSQGSVAEIDTQLEIAKQLGYSSVEEIEATQARLASIGKQLTQLIKSLSNNASIHP